MYNIKHVEDYQNIIKTSNTNMRFKGLWHDNFAPKKNIGDINYLCDKYKVMDKLIDTGDFNKTLVYFVERYLADFSDDYNYDYVSKNSAKTCNIAKFMRCGRSEEQITHMATNIVHRCETDKICLFGGVEKDVEKMKDLIIGHVCYETLVGFYTEAYIRKYLAEKMGRNLNTLLDDEEANTRLDSYGVDIFVSDESNRIKALVQVKPITFINGRNSEDLRRDRAKCYDNDRYILSYMKDNPHKFSNETVLEWFYVFYDKWVTDRGRFDFHDKSIIRFNENIIPNNTNHIFVKKEYLWDTNGNVLYDREYINNNVTHVSLL